MRVVVTGATGFVGRHLLRNAAHEWVGLSRSAPQSGTHEVIESDYSPRSLRRVLSDADAIVHLAAAKASGPAGDSGEVLLENVTLSQEVFDACAVSGVTRIVHLSSRMVYGTSDPMPWSEDVDPHPETYYGLSKLCCEKLPEVVAGSGADLHAVHLRIPQVIGVPGSGVDQHAITRFIARAHAGDELVVVNDVQRQYIYVEDVVSAIVHCLYSTSPRGVFNVTAPESVSVSEAARVISEAAGGRSTVVMERQSPTIPHDVLMDTRKATSELGFVCGWGFEQAIADILARMDPEDAQGRT